MKITDPAHAKRVLEALVEQVKNIDAKGGSKNVKISVEGDANGMKYFWVRYQMGMASIEGAKAVLEVLNDTGNSDLDLIRYQRVAVSLAQAYAPRMKEAGMEVPE